MWMCKRDGVTDDDLEYSGESQLYPCSQKVQLAGTGKHPKSHV